MTQQYQALIDTAFVILVVFSCGHSLFAGRGKGEGQNKRWVTELAEVKEGLRELIGEASAASSNLDRRLTKRRQELENLLHQIDSRELSVRDELPNATWQERATIEVASASSHPGRRKTNTTDSTNRPGPVRENIRSPSRQLDETTSYEREDVLGRKIEILLDGKQIKGAGMQEDKPDPVVYRIAKRLLESGKELHVVAKKLGLPLEEVHVLDRLIRRSASDQVPDPISSTTADRQVQHYNRAMRIESNQESKQWNRELNDFLSATEQDWAESHPSTLVNPAVKRETTYL